MQYFLVSANSSFNPCLLESLVGVEKVETIQSEEIPSNAPKVSPIHDPTGVLTRNLAIPGPPLTDEEMEVLALDMQEMLKDPSRFVPAEKVIANLRASLKEKWDLA
jgi:hypothetical protein